MSDKKTDNKTTNEDDGFEVIDVEEVSSTDTVSDYLKKEASSVDGSKNKENIINDISDVADESSFDSVDEVIDAVMEVEDDTDIDADSNIHDAIDEDAEIPDTDDFDDLEDDDLVAGTPMAGVKGAKTGGRGKLVVGVLALLSVSAVGYYMFAPKASSPVPPVQVPSVEAVAPVTPVTPVPVDTNNVAVVVDEEILEFDAGSDGASSMTEIVTEEVVVVDAVTTGDSNPDNLGEAPNMDIEEVSVIDAPQPDVESSVNNVVSNIADDAIVVAESPQVTELDVDAATPNVMPEEAIMDDLPIDAGDSFDEDVVLDVSEQTADDMDIILLDDTANSDAVGASSSGDTTASNAVPIPPKRDMYFDSVQEVIQREASLQDAGPSEVNPVAEPASKYVVVSDVTPKDSIESKVMQAKRALKLGRYDAAYDFYDRLYKINPRDEAILMGRAVSLHKLGRVRSAVDAYDELLDIYPDNADALVNLLGLVNNTQPAVALQKLLSLRGKHSNNPGVVAQIGLVYASMNNMADAKRYMNIAIGMDPENPQHAYNLAVIYDREGDVANAIKYYDMALSVDAIHGGGRSLNRDVIYDRLIKLR